MLQHLQKLLRRADNKCQLISNGIRESLYQMIFNITTLNLEMAKIAPRSIVVRSVLRFLSWMNHDHTAIKLIFSSIKIKILIWLVAFKEWVLRNLKAGKLIISIDFLYSDERGIL